MLHTILVGLDGSPCADSAIELGIRWASRFNTIRYRLTNHEAVDNYPRTKDTCPGPVRTGRHSAWLRGLHRSLRRGLLLPEQRPEGMRQLSHHARTVRRLAKGQSSRRGNLQRLPRPPQDGPQVSG